MKMWQPAIGSGVYEDGRGARFASGLTGGYQQCCLKLNSVARLKYRAGTALSRDYSHVSDERDKVVMTLGDIHLDWIQNPDKSTPIYNAVC